VSTFSGLNTALTSLYAQRKAIDITGQNITNVNTEGYSRQRVDMQSIATGSIPAFFSKGTGVGGGVNSDVVIRIRDAFLEARAHTEHSSNSRLAEEAIQLDGIESAFREPGDYGLQSVLGTMWAGWQDVANNPLDNASRAQLLQQTTTVAKTLNATRASLDQQWTDTRENLDALVAEINVTSAAIADLNATIVRATQSGLPAHELSDQRDVLVLSLADKIGAVARPGDDGVLNVFVNGTPLVFGATANAVKVAGAIHPDDATTDPVRIEAATGNFAIDVGGTAGGRVKALTTYLPEYRSQLDGVAANLAASINAQQGLGYDGNGAAGTALFNTGGAVGPITAANITVAFTDPALIAASGQPTVPPALPVKDGSNADKIAQLQFDTAGATQSYRRLIVDLGVQTQGVVRASDIQSVITVQVDASREATAGVNLDEEMANMLAFQRAYEAASRMVSAIDETLDVLINRTGLVGR
jgi:flagellar hook-associated protein FlgK